MCRNLKAPSAVCRAKSWLNAADAWDAQIEADARAGKLDHLVKEADADFEAGRCTPL